MIDQRQYNVMKVDNDELQSKLDRYNQQAVKQRWISVNESMPDKDDYYQFLSILVQAYDSVLEVTYSPCYYSSYAGEWFIVVHSNDILLDKAKITHWKPLPESPEL